MPPEDQTNGNTPGEFEDSSVAQTTEFEKPAASLASVSGLFGLRGQTGDTAKPASHTTGFTSSGLAPTSLYVPLPDDATPRTLQGRYRLVAELGMGGMGVTYRAWDSRDGVPVVIKMPRKDVRTNPEIMDRFNREVRTMLELSHEHIVPITDHGEEEGCPFVAMRFLPGGSLSEYRGRDEAGKAARLSPSTLHFWLPGIARALDFMHSSGVLHRDVKPGNIFLDGFLKPFLGDFGIAKVVDESGGLNREYTLTATRMAVGTPEYMAPELFRPGGSPDGRVDQYALAVTVYEMLAGRKPFRGDSAHIIVEHASKEAPPLDEFCPDAPASLVEAVHKGLAKNPEDRFTTCSELANAVLAETPLLNIDTSLARLLCPSCRAILRVSGSTAGKRGTCPKCKSPVAVAHDLGSLWLSGEDRSTIDVGNPAEFVAEEQVHSPDASEASEEATISLVPAAPKSKSLIPGIVTAVVIGTLLASIWLASPLGSPPSRSWLWNMAAFAPHLFLIVGWFFASRRTTSLCDRRLLTPGVMLLCASFHVLPIAISLGWRSTTLMWWLSFTHFTGVILVLLGHSPNRLASFDLVASDSTDPVEAFIRSVLMHSLTTRYDGAICFQPHQDYTSLLIGSLIESKAACRIELPKTFADLVIRRVKEIHRTCLLREAGDKSGLIRMDGLMPMALIVYSEQAETGEIVLLRLNPCEEMRLSSKASLACFGNSVVWEQFGSSPGNENPCPMFVSDFGGGGGGNAGREFLADLSLMLKSCHVRQTSAVQLENMLQQAVLADVDADADVLDWSRVSTVSEVFKDTTRLTSRGPLYFIRADAEAHRRMQANVHRVVAPLFFQAVLVLLVLVSGDVLDGRFYSVAFAISLGLLISRGILAWVTLYLVPAQLVEIADHSMSYVGRDPILLSSVSSIWIAKPSVQDSPSKKPTLLYVRSKGIAGLVGEYVTVFETFAGIRKAFEDRGVRVKV